MKYKLVRLALGIIFCLFSHSGLASIQAINNISLISSNADEKISVSLPYFYQQKQSGLAQVDWEIELPLEIASTRLPTLLIPQPVQGVSIWMNGELIYEAAGSDHMYLHNWYRPILISIPRNIISSQDKFTLQVQQSGHLRGWYIAPMFVGDLSDLQPLYNRYLFISQTLSVTINFISALIGLFLIFIGIQSKKIKYFYGGGATLIWSLLFTLALIDEVRTDLWFSWRLILYFLTGNVIAFISLFMFSVFNEKIPRIYFFILIISLNMEWIVFLFGGRSVEYILDFYWTFFGELIYAAAMLILIFRIKKYKSMATLVPFFLHSAVSFLFAFHDYFLQAGGLNFNFLNGINFEWKPAILQPIYLTHLALPSFSIMALWMLSKDHIESIKSAVLHERKLRLQRERLISDIHDGVGGRINFLLWMLRSKTDLSINYIEFELQRCIDELRFTINPKDSGYETLNKSLINLCQRLQNSNSGVLISYQRIGAVVEIDSEKCLQFYKITQECLSNALRHSHATHISIDLVQTNFEVYLLVKDNGNGIPKWDEKLQKQLDASNTSLGIEGLKNRMLRFGGSLHISSNDQGTAVKACFQIIEPPDVRIPRHGGHDSTLMADSIPA